MSPDVLWCDEFVRLDPTTGAATDGDGQSGLEPPVRLTAPRNAFAAFQLLVGPIQSGASVSVSGGLLRCGEKTKISSRQYDVYVEWYQTYDGVTYPEVCVPQEWLDGSTPAVRKRNGIRKQRHAGFWVDLFVPSDARPGDYAGNVTVTVDGEKTKVPVELTVTRATLPADCCLDVSMNNYAPAIGRGWGLGMDEKGLRDPKTIRCERGVWQAAHDHRMFLHYLPYGHSGYIPPGFAPPLESEGPNKRVASWTEWDKRWGPYFDGSAFRKTRRGPVPVKRFYLPLNLHWPADFVKYGQPGYEAEWRAVGGQMVDHFKKKGWTGTRFDMFLNHKQRFRYFPWDTEEVRFLEDNDNHRYFRTLWEGTFDRAATKPVTFDYTLGTTWTYNYDIRSDLAEFIDVYIAGTRFIAWDADRIPELHANGRQLWSCTNSGNCVTSTRSPYFVPVQLWMLDIDGYMPYWLTTGGWGPDAVNGTGSKGATTFLYAGSAFDSEETLASVRMKVQRQALQTADQLQLAADAAGKDAVKADVNDVLGVDADNWAQKRPDFVLGKPPKDWVGADFATEEPAVVGWKKFSTEQFRMVRGLAERLAAEK
jgi:hypothetical protein